ncbi:MAG: hypothetical protein H0X59_07420, partial [Chloroflexi bacterium]|nr:hypothetical protein [Chloroflexota bacterium]
MTLSCPGMSATGESRIAEEPRSISWSFHEPAAAALLVVSFFVLRTTGLGAPLPEAWAALAAAVALVSPLAGLLTAVALGPFDDWSVLGTEAGGRAVLVAAVAVSVAARALPGAVGQWRGRRITLRTPAGIAVAAAIVVLIGTGLG